MNATILDGHVLNPGDLSWEGFRKYGDVAIYDRTAEEDVIPRALGSEVIITNKVTFSRERMEKLPGLRYIGITATGYNIVDVKAAHELGITVTNVPEYSTEGVAESVFAHILRFTHRVSEHSAIVKNGGWKESGDFSFTAYPLIEIYGKRMGIIGMGIIGMGHIGMRTGEIAKAFGMDVAYASRSPKPKAIEMGFRPLPLEELLSTSDFISLHLPLTDETRNIMSREHIALMKTTAFLINTARGALVDEKALAEAIEEGRIAGAGVDVLNEEPPRHGSPLLAVDECCITPHIAWAAKETRSRLMQKAEENLAAFLSGNPINVVS